MSGLKHGAAMEMVAVQNGYRTGQLILNTLRTKVRRCLREVGEITLLLSYSTLEEDLKLRGCATSVP